MKDLKCGLRGCKYNRGYCCCSKEIKVDSLTDCTTYAPVPGKSDRSFEAGADFVKADYSVDTDVACNAECVFNREGKCVSNGITVMHDADKPASCLTFMPRH